MKLVSGLEHLAKVCKRRTSQYLYLMVLYRVQEEAGHWETEEVAVQEVAVQEEAGHRETEEEELMPGCCCPVLVLHAQQHLLGISWENVHLVKSHDSA